MKPAYKCRDPLVRRRPGRLSAAALRAGRTGLDFRPIITGDAAESLEVMYPYQRLLEAGYQVDIAAPVG